MNGAFRRHEQLSSELSTEFLTYDLSDKCTWARARVSSRRQETRGYVTLTLLMVRSDGEFTTKYRDAGAYVPLISFAPPA